MALWTVQMTCFNVEAESGEEAFELAYEAFADDEPDLVITDMQPYRYKVDFSEGGA